MKLVLFKWMIMVLMGGSIVYAQVSVEADPLREVQTWKGKNGKAFRGKFVKREGDVIHVMKDRGDAVYKIEFDNFHRDTKVWLLRALTQRKLLKKQNSGERVQSSLKVEKLKAGVVFDLGSNISVDKTGYKAVEDATKDRSLIPNFNQSDYGKKASDCVPNSFAMFMAWWEVRKWVDVTVKGRDYDDQVEWLHTRLARSLKTRNNSGTGTHDVSEELSDFLTDEVKSKAAFTYQIVEDYRPEVISKYVTGANCTVLCVSVYYGDKYQSGHAVALKSLSEDGELEFNTWGMALKGKMKVVPDSEHEKRITTIDEQGRRKYVMAKLPTYEIELMNRVDLPEWFVDDEVKFVLELEKWDSLAVLTPYMPVGEDTEKAAQ